MWPNRWLPGTWLCGGRKVFGPVSNIHVSVFDSHEMRLGAFVIEEAREPGVLRDGRGFGIRLKLARQLFLQPFDRVAIEACDAPEDVHVIG